MGRMQGTRGLIIDYPDAAGGELGWNFNGAAEGNGVLGCGGEVVCCFTV